MSVLGVQLLFSIRINQPEVQMNFIELAVTLGGRQDM